jgi:hypothetical protein
MYFMHLRISYSAQSIPHVLHAKSSIMAVGNTRLSDLLFRSSNHSNLSVVTAFEFPVFLDFAQ